MFQTLKRQTALTTMLMYVHVQYTTSFSHRLQFLSLSWVPIGLVQRHRCRCENTPLGRSLWHLQGPQEPCTWPCQPKIREKQSHQLKVYTCNIVDSVSQSLSLSLSLSLPPSPGHVLQYQSQGATWWPDQSLKCMLCAYPTWSVCSWTSSPCEQHKAWWVHRPLSPLCEDGPGLWGAVCVCVCVCVCVYRASKDYIVLYMYTIHVHAWLYMYTCMYVQGHTMYVHVCTCTYTCIYMYYVHIDLDTWQQTFNLSLTLTSRCWRSNFTELLHGDGLLVE